MIPSQRFLSPLHHLRGVVVLAVASAVYTTANAALPTTYFPAEVAEPVDVAGWTALAEEYPRWVKPVRSDPTRSVDTPAATQVVINDKIGYVRVRRLENDLESIQSGLNQPGLIIDLRYVHGDRNETIRLGRLLARRQVALRAANATDDETIIIDSNPQRTVGQTTLVVVNGGTSGPVEALLDALQSQGDVLLVGTNTAGNTGLFRRPETAPGWQVIYGDLRRREGAALVDVGVAPELAVATDPAAEEAAYLGLDGGTVFAHLLDAPVEKARFDEERLLQEFDESHQGTGLRRPEPSANEDASDGENAEVPFDRALHRAVSTLLALEALGRLCRPPSRYRAVDSSSDEASLFAPSRWQVPAGMFC